MTRPLARSAGLIGLATFSSRILGLIRDQLFAIYFGAGAAMDAFYVAARVPSLLRDLFAEGAMSAAFVPTFTRYLTMHGKDAAWRLGSQVLNALVFITGVLVIVGIVFTEPFLGLFARGYVDDPQQLSLTATLTRITLPFLTLIAVAAAFMGMLNALRRFFAPAISPAIFNVASIISLIVLYPLLVRWGQPPILALAIGMLIGGLAQILAQVPSLRREGFRHALVLDPRDRGLREVLLLMGPGTIGVAAAQVNLFVNTALATHAETGAVTWLQWAFRLMYLPIGIFGVSVATAAIPEVARHAALGETDAMRRTLSMGFRLMLMLSVPATIGLIVLSEPIMSLLFQWGAVTPQAAVMSAAALAFYAPGLAGYSIVKLVSPSFYALRDARTPVTVSVISIVINLVLNLWLFRLMGFRGLALGTAIAATVNALLLLVLLSRKIGGIDAARVLTAFLKISVASAIMGAAVWAVDGWLAARLPEALLLRGTAGIAVARSVRVFGAIGVGLGVLALAAHLLHIEEFRTAMQRVVRRLRPAAPK
jgi:putative peptidoglycan lipid II flippase